MADVTMFARSYHSAVMMINGTLQIYDETASDEKLDYVIEVKKLSKHRLHHLFVFHKIRSLLPHHRNSHFEKAVWLGQ